MHYVLLNSYQRKTAENVLDTILNIQPKDSGGGSGETREAKVYRLANDMLEKLPSDYLPHEVKDRMRKMGQLQPMNIFLKQVLHTIELSIYIVPLFTFNNIILKTTDKENSILK